MKFNVLHSTVQSLLQVTEVSVALSVCHSQSDCLSGGLLNCMCVCVLLCVLLCVCWCVCECACGFPFEIIENAKGRMRGDP